MFDRWRKRNKFSDRSKDSYRNGNSHLIELNNVVKIYESTAGSFTALRNVDLQVGSGEFVAVIGKSGSGKSTLINMITGIDRPTSGQVLVGDTQVDTLSEDKLAAWRGRYVGIIFQFFQLLPTLTVVENVMLPMDFCHLYSMRERRERAMSLLDQVGVAEHAHKLPSAVSGGQQQRVAIARALANDPPIIIADEPTGNLDSKTAEAVFKLFDGLVAQNKTVLMVTHDRDLAERVSRTLILSDGEIIEEYLARTFPALTEAQLVQATRGVEAQRYAPGTIILEEGAQPDRLYVITKGQVDVVLNGNSGQEIVSTTLNSGQYFGEIELLRGGRNIATIRAGHQSGAEVAALNQAVFDSLLAEATSLREELYRTVSLRVAENQANRRRTYRA
jgi:ABC-type lipoprotein export system ATPase subunit